jgi:hypothetical protein
MPALHRLILTALAVTLLPMAHVHAADPSPLWGRIANPELATERIRTTLFFAGQASDGSNPYNIADPPGDRTFLYTARPADDRHLRWSESPDHREFAMSQMIGAGINVVTMSSWGESFLDSRPRPPWAVYAPMQTSPGSHDELFAAAVGKRLVVTPLIESRGDWNLRQEFPSPQGSVAPGAVSQVVDLVNRYLKNDNHPEWADQWTRVFDRDGEERFAVAIIHASSNNLQPHEHAAYAAGFDAIADEVFAQTGVKVGFFLDVLARNSFAPGDFKPTPEQTGPELFARNSILGLQNFLPEIWAGVPSEAARMDWKRDFSSRWAATGIPFLMDVAPGYNAEVVFPGSVKYGHNPDWINGLTAMVQDFGHAGVVFNSWNGYTEAMLAMNSIEYGDTYYNWLRTLTAIHDQREWIGAAGNWSNGFNWSNGRPDAQRRAVLDNGGIIRINSAESAQLVDVGTGPGRGGTVRVSDGAELTIHDGGLRLGLADGGAGSLGMTGGSILISGGFNMFLVGDHGSGTARISGGSISARTVGIALQPTSVGHLELSGDAVINTTGDRFVMGMVRDTATGQRPRASMKMTGGTINVTAGASGFPDAVISFGGVADVEMSGGTINVDGLYVSAVAGASGATPSAEAVINQSGGTINANRMAISERGTTDYHLSGSGEINVGRRLILGWLEGSQATLTQSGGEINVDTGGQALNAVGLLIGERGTASYVMNGGALNVPRTLWMAEFADAVGRMHIGGGAVNVGQNFAVGLRGDAELTQSGGELNIDGSLHIGNGDFATSVAAHHHSGGVLNVVVTINIGRQNAPTISSISGGTVTAGSRLRVWSTGTLHYDGGTIDTPVLQVDGGGQVLFGTGGDKSLAVDSLIVDAAGGGVIDLTDNELLVRSGDLAAIHELVGSGYANGSWTGHGINSSMAASQPGRALGVRSGADGVRIRFTWAGDATLDGTVTVADLSILAANWQGTGKGWWEGDFNYDGQVTVSDLSILAANWQAGVGGGSTMSFEDAMAMFDAFNGVVIPEPGVLSLLGMTGLLVLRRRFRSCRRSDAPFEPFSAKNA